MNIDHNVILIKNFNLKNISSFKIGGRVKYYFIPDDLIDLKNFLITANRDKKGFLLIGNATNILFSDKFYDSTIISLKGFTNYIHSDKNRVIVGAGAELNTLIDLAIRNSLKGIEKLSGIPGSLGGALIMNAGAFDAEIGSCVEYIKVITSSGKIKILHKDKIKFSYRKAVPLNKYIILEACLKLKKGNKKTILKTKKEVLKKRMEKQPINIPSCGSIFKRPAGCFPGTLIEKCGLKGYSIGGARISEKHCNFIINTGNAKAKDVMKLIQFIQKQVYKKFKTKLSPEIKFFNFT